MAKRDLIVSFLSSVPNGIRAKLQNDPLCIPCPVTQAGGNGYPGGRDGYRQWLSEKADGQNLIPGLFRSAGGGVHDTIGKVAVMGFSNGCIGVDETLAYKDAFQIDTVIACDGIHGQWVDPIQKTMNISMYKNYFNFGVHVLGHDPENDINAPSMVVTHSSIIPGSFPSTTDTAYYVWNKVVGKAMQVHGENSLRCGPTCLERIIRLADTPVDFGPCEYMGYHSFWNLFSDSWYERLSAGNFSVWGWGDIKDGRIVTRDPTGHCDHIFQGQAVLNQLMGEYLVKRWNTSCSAAAGFGVTPMQPSICNQSQGCEYGEGKEKQDFFSDLPEGGGGSATVPAPKCPTPPPGYVLSPVEGKPCNLEELKTPGGIIVSSESKVFTAENMFAFASGAVLGYLGYRAINKRFQ